MPTGYTDAIGKGATFEEFVWSCARAFGALVMMRDDPTDAPIPEFEPHTEYYDGRLAECEAKLKELREMSPQQANAAASRAHEAEMETWRQREVERKDLEAKYSAMRERVATWEPPTPDHAGLKRFMLEQIDESIRFDCSPWDAPSPLDGPEWMKREIERAARGIASSHENIAGEIARAKERNAWVKALDESVARPVKLRAASARLGG